uniref:VWFD domain-containing protein n=1 Tax=Craspedostauros australis TaxID=1486917 RepID=A0A7R9WQ56_9STRA|mmetsp:Transcript_14083/g.38732  ORF Transcript_14083/g.38732 Transcript_14083/m.38732 type:complete len:1329 (+) Transcript_14083:116-4102(+)|eukprot:CAMPEP_0198108138 /NCGR_PEP_ID=MMETSP1442-20131203/228_1 /TAXON_ID= /ORGANISM="Craspedostauros australis, Strain CCMP3328" /LENGTH=1328 /DNA_ID=CAMNT_0043763351 /DNA_START=110 /DNA_END=4096 /DNA_ORIENTATION=+
MIALSAFSGRLILLVSFTCLMLVSGDMGNEMTMSTKRTKARRLRLRDSTSNTTTSANTKAMPSQSKHDKAKSKSKISKSDTMPSTCNQDEAGLFFAGVTRALSASPGLIEMTWRPAQFFNTTENFDVETCEDIVYELFIAEGTVNFTETPLDDLRADGSVQTYETTGLAFTAENLVNGAMYSLLLVAKVGDGWVSSNRDASVLTISSADPIIRQSVNVVALEHSTSLVQYEGDSLVSVQGDDTEGLVAKTWITGLDVLGQPYIVQLISVDSMSGQGSNGATFWNVRNGTLVDIYERLSISVAMEVPNDPDDDDEQTNSGRSLQSDIAVLETFRRTFNFEASEQFGPAKIEYKATTVFMLQLSLEIDFPSLLSAGQFEVSVELNVKLSQTATFTAEGSISESVDEDEVLVEGRTVTVRFLAAGVPVFVLVTPAIDVFLQAQFDFNGKLVVTAKATDSVGWRVKYSLFDGWESTPILPPPTRDIGYELDAKATFDLYEGARLRVDLLIYGAILISPYVESGPAISIEAVDNPNPVINDDPINQLFHFNKFDLDLKAAIGVRGLFELDLPILGLVSVSFDVNVPGSTPLQSLPSAKVVISDFIQCTGDDAIQLMLELQEEPYTLPLDNALEDRYNSIVSPDNLWMLEDQLPDQPTARLTLKRSTIEMNDFFRLPNGETIYFVASADDPSLPVFSLLFEQALGSIEGLPELEPFDCCDVSDCELKFSGAGMDATPSSCVDFMCIEGSPSPTSPLTPSPTPLDDDADEAGGYGDPHLFTYDGVQYSCQGGGDFVLTKSLDSTLMIQARFKKQNLLVSFITAIVIRSGDPGSPVVEIAISEDESRAVYILVDGNVATPTQTQTSSTSVYEDPLVRIEASTRNYDVWFKANNLRIFNSLRLPSSFPHFQTRVSLPTSFRNERIIGLLGSNNNDPTDEWSDRDGNVLPLAPFRYGSDAYNYCVPNWCIQDETESLFNYTDEYSFDYHSFCDDPFPGDVDTSQASQEILDICGLDLSCIIDGIELGVEGSSNALEAQAELVNTNPSSRFQFAPSSIQAGSPNNVQITLDFNTVDNGADAAQAERFNIYRIDSATFEIASPVLVALRDDGAGVDDTAGDLIFTNVLALLSSTGGEVFSYTAIPVIGGVEVPDSPLRTTAATAVISFSVQSGLGSVGNATLQTLVADSIDELVIVVEYSWPADQSDLDTGTIFLDGAVGYDCGASPYMSFSGDSTATGGSETVKIRVGDAYNNGDWVDSTIVDMNADWFSSAMGSGPASLTVFIESLDQGSGGQTVVSPAYSFVINPGMGSGCASTDAAVALVTLNEDDGRVVILVIPA